MTNLTSLSDLDVFFFYDENPLELENESDLVAGLIQPRRSMFYNRQDGCGISSRENLPNSLTLEIGLRYDIVNWASLRNRLVSDGSDDTRDRRIALSQNTVSFVRNKKGDLDIKVAYIPFANIKAPGSVQAPLAGGI